MRYLIILSLLTFTSCYSIKSFKPSRAKINLEKENLFSLNGKYEVVSTNNSSRYLDLALFAKSAFNAKNRPSENDYVTLEVISKRKIKVSCFQNGKLVRSKVLRGKVKDNYFVFRKKRSFIFYFIANAIRTQKTRIGVMKNGNLIMDNSGGGIVFFFFIPIGNGVDEYHHLIFRKIE